MNVYVGQIYADAGASYPFSSAWQQYLGRELSNKIGGSKYFEERFGEGQNLIFRVSAKRGAELVEVKGPTHFKRDKDVEFTIFLPHAGGKVTRDTCQRAMYDFFVGVSQILLTLQIDVAELKAASGQIINQVMTHSEMFEAA